MVANWPDSLPANVLEQGYRESEPDVTIYTQTETGPGKVRPRFTAGRRPVSGIIRISSEQKATLSQFYRVTLAHGSLPFTWKLHSTGEEVTYRFKPGEPPEYRPSRAPGFWDASLSLEVLP